jgi:hypothetical protein
LPRSALLRSWRRAMNDPCPMCLEHENSRRQRQRYILIQLLRDVKRSVPHTASTCPCAIFQSASRRAEGSVLCIVSPTSCDVSRTRKTHPNGNAPCTEHTIKCEMAVMDGPTQSTACHIKDMLCPPWTLCIPDPLHSGQPSSHGSRQYRVRALRLPSPLASLLTTLRTARA